MVPKNRPSNFRDEVRTKDEYEEEIVEQDVLTRCGWRFIRVRAGSYYINKEKVVKELVEKIRSILE